MSIESYIPIIIIILLSFNKSNQWITLPQEECPMTAGDINDNLALFTLKTFYTYSKDNELLSSIPVPSIIPCGKVYSNLKDFIILGHHMLQSKQSYIKIKSDNTLLITDYEFEWISYNFIHNQQLEKSYIISLNASKRSSLEVYKIISQDIVFHKEITIEIIDDDGEYLIEDSSCQSMDNHEIVICGLIKNKKLYIVLINPSTFTQIGMTVIIQGAESNVLQVNLYAYNYRELIINVVKTDEGANSMYFSMITVDTENNNIIQKQSCFKIIEMIQSRFNIHYDFDVIISKSEITILWTDHNINYQQWVIDPINGLSRPNVGSLMPLDISTLTINSNASFTLINNASEKIEYIIVSFDSKNNDIINTLLFFFKEAKCDNVSIDMKLSSSIPIPIIPLTHINYKEEITFGKEINNDNLYGYFYYNNEKLSGSLSLTIDDITSLEFRSLRKKGLTSFNYQRIYSDRMFGMSFSQQCIIYINISFSLGMTHCYFSCEECSSYGSKTDHQCTECKKSSYPLSTKQSNCYDAKSIPDGYYLNLNLIPPQWEKCSINCKTCRSLTICDTCLPNTFYYEKSCHKTCQSHLYFYYNSCVSSCPLSAVVVNRECIDIFEQDDKPPIPSNEDNTLKRTRLEYSILLKSIMGDLIKYARQGLIIKGNNYSSQLYLGKDEDITNQCSKKHKLSSIDLGNCTKTLRNHYNLTQEDIIIVKTDINQSDSYAINEVEYLFYDSKNDRLDMELCKDTLINMTLPIIKPSLLNLTKIQQMINQKYDTFDSGDEFYHNICTPFTSVNGADVTLKDRRNDYYPNVSLCPIRCDYLQFNFMDMTIECLCRISDRNKEKEKSNEVLAQNNTIENFKELPEETYFDIIYCYRLVFNTQLIIENAGFWIILFFLIIKTCLLLYILYKGLNNLRPSYQIPKSCPSQQNTNIKSKNKKGIKISTMQPLKSQGAIPQAQQFKYFNSNIVINKLRKLNGSNHNMGNSPPPRDDDNDNSSHSSKKFSTSRLFSKIRLEFKDAIINDTRTITQLIQFFMKKTHPMLTTFAIETQYELKGLKVMLFLDSIALDFGINPLFYSNSFIERRYSSNRSSHIPLILLYSFFTAMITIVIKEFLSYLILSKRIIENFLEKEQWKKGVLTQLKTDVNHTDDQNVQVNSQANIMTQSINQIQNKMNLVSIVKKDEVINVGNGNVVKAYTSDPFAKEKIEFEKQSKKLMSITRLKVIIFIILSYILIGLLWYYVCVFCAVLKNCQISWFLGGLVSFGMRMVISFLVTVLLALGHYLALRNQFENMYLFIWVTLYYTL